MAFALKGEERQNHQQEDGGRLGKAGSALAGDFFSVWIIWCIQAYLGGALSLCPVSVVNLELRKR